MLEPDEFASTGYSRIGRYLRNQANHVTFRRMKINTIAVDLDGTLLNESGEVSPLTRATVQKAQQRGYEVLLCTGRHHLDAEHITREIGLTAATVTSNGAMLRSAAPEPLAVHPLSPDQACLVIERMDHLDLGWIMYTDAGIYISPHSPVVIWYQRRDRQLQGGLRLKVTPTTPETVLNKTETILKMAVYSEELPRLEDLDRALEGRGMQNTRSSPHNREIMDEGISKKSALERYLGDTGRSFSNLMAIGDSENDLEMVQAAAIGVAMANAEPPLKTVADMETQSNWADGVAWIIERLLSGELENRLVPAG